MREPAFWYGPPSLLSRLLAPIGTIYGGIAARRMRRAGRDAGVPVLCIGNYHVGGAGKTPTTITIARILRAMGELPFVVSRGYGGQLKGPIRVDRAAHAASDVGDEALMMARELAVVVARDRVAGAALARAQGASVILLDDGFQNPALAKDASLIVIDSVRGIGNGGIFPAGPLRAPLAPQIERTTALVVVGEGGAAANIEEKVAGRGGLIFHGSLTPAQNSVDALRGQRLFAFAGIGDPERFFSTLRLSGLDVAKVQAFADHHAFSTADIERLVTDAAAQALTLVTTEKDLVRIHGNQELASHFANIVPFPVTLEIAEKDKLCDFLTARLVQAT